MMAYNFLELSPIEFEDLVNDLLQAELSRNPLMKGLRVERFKEGRDQGIDGRIIDEEKKITIIQSKHYYKTGFSGLRSILKESTKKGKPSGEIIKVKNLASKSQLDRYIFATSVSLSPENKKEIFTIFSPYIEDESDIYGLDELNALLQKYKYIEEKYIKLYTKSPIVLEKMLSRVVNNDINGRSKDALESYRDKSEIFYETEDFGRSLKVLERNHVLVIAGEPGAGKSTLSEQLCLRLVLKKGFNFFKVKSDISEVEKVWSDNEKQIFYFDDFLGSNYLEKIDGQDSDIKNFIERVKRAKKNPNIKSKIFILNSRTTILKSGIENSAISGFKEDIEDNEFVLEVKNMSQIEKAYVLYNHMYYQDLKQEYINEIFENKNYEKIINHSNYSPRIVEFITNNNRVLLESNRKYIDFAIDSLDNPEKIWQQVFEKQSNKYINFLVDLVVFNGGTLGEYTLQNRYNEYFSESTNAEYQYENIIQIAIKNFLVRKKYKETVMYSVINPSISDYIIYKYINNANIIVDRIHNLGSFEGLNRINTLFKYYSKRNNTKGFKFHKEVIEKLLKKDFSKKDIDYQFKLLTGAFVSEAHEQEHLNVLQKSITSNLMLNTSNVKHLLYEISNYKNKLKFTNDDFLIHYIRNIELEEDDYMEIGEITDFLLIEGIIEEISELLLYTLEKKIIETIIRNNESSIEDLDIDDYVEKDNQEREVYYDEEGAKDSYINVYELIESLNYDIYYFIKDDLDYGNMQSSLEDLIEEKFEEYRESMRSESDDSWKDMRGGTYNSTSYVNEVDFIFANT